MECQSLLVEDWLKALDLSQYTQSFFDNGYDELEICKHIGDEDLDAIGVMDVSHRKIILSSVQMIRLQSGPVVYFNLDPDYADNDYDVVYSSNTSLSLIATTTATTTLTQRCPDSPLPPLPKWDRYPSKHNRVTFTSIQLYSILRDKLDLENLIKCRPAQTNVLLHNTVSLLLHIYID